MHPTQTWHADYISLPPLQTPKYASCTFYTKREVSFLACSERNHRTTNEQTEREPLSINNEAPFSQSRDGKVCRHLCVYGCVAPMTVAVKSSRLPIFPQIGLWDDATTQLHPSLLCCMHSCCVYVCVSMCVCVCLDNGNTSFLL